MKCVICWLTGRRAGDHIPRTSDAQYMVNGTSVCGLHVEDAMRLALAPESNPLPS